MTGLNARSFRIASAVLLACGCCSLSGCFSATVRWWGNQPSTGVKVAAATTDVITSPIQVPVLVASKIGQPKYDREAALKLEAQHEQERAKSLAVANDMLARLHETPGLLTDDTFWAEQPVNDGTAMLGLLWFLQEKTAPASPAINAYLLKRFPDYRASILSNGRVTHAELTGLAADSEQPYAIRESALDALLRDDTFDFGEPWRRIVIDKFTLKATLLFGTRRYTRQELIALSSDPTVPKWIQQMATDNVGRNWFKPE